MPELRKDPITGRWVIISTDRAKRPNDFLRETVAPNSGGFCPFCPGNEGKTPPEILAYRSNGSGPNSAGWTVRGSPSAASMIAGAGRKGIGNRRPSLSACRACASASRFMTSR